MLSISQFFYLNKKIISLIHANNEVSISDPDESVYKRKTEIDLLIIMMKKVRIELKR